MFFMSKKILPSTKQKIRTSAVMAVVLAAGIAIGFTLDRSVALPVDSKAVAAFITNNPELIKSALSDLNNQRDDEGRLQAFTLLRAHDGETVMGNPDGDITIYEFSDYNCGFCKRALPRMKSLLAEDGNIRLVIKEYPILAESSYDAATLALRAADQGKYEAVHTALMEWRGRINETVLTSIATKHGIEGFSIDRSETGQYRQIIADNMRLGHLLGVEGTPAFIIDEIIVPGLIPKEQMKSLIAEVRKAADSGDTSGAS